jgi:hypothetical protein
MPVESKRARRRRARRITVLHEQSGTQHHLILHLAAILDASCCCDQDTFGALSDLLREARTRHLRIEVELRGLQHETWLTRACVLCGGSLFSCVQPFVPCTCTL